MPNKFVQINSKSSMPSALQQINRNFQFLDQEVNTKTYSQAGGSSMISGKLSNGRYGELFYDAQGTPRILIGQAGDGRPGIWITKQGYSVMDEVG